jgi:hypothetical protein
MFPLVSYSYFYGMVFWVFDLWIRTEDTVQKAGTSTTLVVEKLLDF